MDKIIKINGMMCEKCENKVKEALSKISTVKSVSRDAKEAVIVDAKVDNTVLKNTVEDLGFEVTEILEK